MKKLKELFKDKFYRRIFLFFIILGVFYILNTYSPSSYGIMLKKLEVKNTGLVLGEARAIRSDEWAVITPLTQATVNNKLGRYNSTSLYNEDLRMNYGLPVNDWGLIFKPTMWLYPFVNPAFAFSFHWYSLFVLYILGYFFLFKKIGLSKVNSMLLSLGVYFTGFTQFWWTDKGPVMAIFPWVILVLLMDIPIFISLILFYWISIAWFLTNFYPPIFLSLTFVGALFIIVYGKKWFKLKNFLLLTSTAVLAAGTAMFYIKDYLLKTTTTIYPGPSRGLRGGDVPILEYLSQYFPYITFNSKFESIIGENISEVGTVGIYFILLALCFIDYSKFNIKEIIKRKEVKVFGIGIILMTSWMLLPIPSIFGKIFLWDNVQPERMEYAEGILFVMFFAYIFNNVELKINKIRIMIFTSIVLVSWFIFKLLTGNHYRENIIDLYIIPILLLFLLLYKLKKMNLKTAILAASTMTGILVVSYFNPIQKAWPIFNRERTKTYDLLDKMVDKDGVLIVEGFPAATLNGIGYKSMAHTTAVPEIKFWRDKYPDLSEEKFMKIFNRYSHIILGNFVEPILINTDAVGIPSGDFIQGKGKIFNQKGTENIATPLYNNQEYTGEITNNYEKMKIKGFGIFIGNNGGESNGKLSLLLCNKAECVNGTYNVSNSIDNNYIKINLDRQLNIEKRDRVSYKLSISDSTIPLIIWTFKDNDNKPKIKLFTD